MIQVMQGCIDCQAGEFSFCPSAQTNARDTLRTCGKRSCNAKNKPHSDSTDKGGYTVGWPVAHVPSSFPLRLLVCAGSVVLLHLRGQPNLRPSPPSLSVSASCILHSCQYRVVSFRTHFLKKPITNHSSVYIKITIWPSPPLFVVVSRRRIRCQKKGGHVANERKSKRK